LLLSVEASRQNAQWGWMVLLLKIPAALIGFLLTLGGLGAFFWSVWLAVSPLM